MQKEIKESKEEAGLDYNDFCSVLTYVTINKFKEPIIEILKSKKYKSPEINDALKGYRPETLGDHALCQVGARLIIEYNPKFVRSFSEKIKKIFQVTGPDDPQKEEKVNTYISSHPCDEKTLKAVYFLFGLKPSTPIVEGNQKQLEDTKINAKANAQIEAVTKEKEKLNQEKEDLLQEKQDLENQLKDSQRTNSEILEKLNGMDKEIPFNDQISKSLQEGDLKKNLALQNKALSQAIKSKDYDKASDTSVSIYILLQLLKGDTQHD